MATTLILLGGLSPDYVLASSWGFGQSVLHKLVIRDRPDQLDRVEQLLREGTDVNAKTTEEHKHPSRTPLQCCPQWQFPNGRTAPCPWGRSEHPQWSLIQPLTLRNI
ncbi:MAG: hypothetical protein OXH47_03090 [Paracoccaceae bacterium]|nr:hypothetical protein [Paracoccaceae bacterium]